MTPKPPREFWLTKGSDGDIYVSETKEHATSVENCFNQDEIDYEAIHVVEHSALTDAQHEIVKLKALADTTEQSNRSYEKALDDALADYDKLLDEVMQLRLAKDPECIDAVKQITITHLNAVVERMKASREKQSAIISVLAEALEEIAAVRCAWQLSQKVAKDALEKLKAFRGEK